MKRMKSIVDAAAPDHYVAVGENPRIRLKHRILTMDFAELQKETATMRKKLQTINRKKMTLIAEVRFLRLRYEFLAASGSSKRPETVQPKTLEARNITSSKAKKPPPVPRSDSYHKRKGSSRKEARDLNLKQKVKVPPIPDLNRIERTNPGINESGSKCKVPFFDLNQISREEEELDPNTTNEPLMGLDSKILRNKNDEAEIDVKLSSACRDGGKGSNLVGKRKISWQDHLALRA